MKCLKCSCKIEKDDVTIFNLDPKYGLQLEIECPECECTMFTFVEDKDWILSDD